MLCQRNIGQPACQKPWRERTLFRLIIGALTFFPALALGPIVEHLMMFAGKSF
ncbi:MAG TPA: hypothetical protein DCK76_10770 [Desulfotomaculum sp.]|nr:hypothetical protein [Desulfotomaculum sp.]HBY03198.1 hypothetical protein [Desulfotomaculum sp.]